MVGSLGPGGVDIEAMCTAPRKTKNYRRKPKQKKTKTQEHPGDRRPRFSGSIWCGAREWHDFEPLILGASRGVRLRKIGPCTHVTARPLRKLPSSVRVQFGGVRIDQ